MKEPGLQQNSFIKNLKAKKTLLQVMSIYPYEGRNLFEESFERENIFNDLRRPRNSKGYGPSAVFSLPEERASGDYLASFLNKHFFPLTWEGFSPSFFEEKRDLFLANNPLRGFTVCVDPFASRLSKPSLSLWRFTEGHQIPVLSNSPKDRAVLGFCSSDLSVWEPEYCRWFVDYLRRVFLALGAKFAWCALFDHLARFEKKNPRQYVFGMTFYGSDMVNEIGKEKLLSAPVYRAEELENGGVMLMLGEQPFFPHPKAYRDGVARHLGLDEPKKMDILVPGWLESTKPGVLIIPADIRFHVIAGAKAENLTLGDSGVTLFDYFMEKVYDFHELPVPEEQAFAGWFNKLDTGLQAFVAGSCYRNQFEAYVGLRVHRSIKFNFYQKKLNKEKMKKAQKECTTLFRDHGLTGKTRLAILALDGTESGV